MNNLVRFSSRWIRYKYIIINNIGCNYLDKPGEPEHGIHADYELEEIERREGHEIEDERSGPDVVSGQFLGVENHQPLFQVTGAKLDGHVDEEHNVAERVHGIPPGGRDALQLGQTLPDDGRPKVVHCAHAQQHQPVEVRVFVRIDHGPREFVLLPAQTTFPTMIGVFLRTGTKFAVITRVHRVLKHDYFDIKTLRI